ncbi:lytic transglycosylase domain-containing protein [Polaromonas naphthalenivorans]|uniref:Lytic transglycosylase, catalytic n=1 Tax=Polaromonas naphthalenivorans (strain CJ2) TaxID=365044 RepID=A1VLI7_POLNA|nr:lytic transglycosylase domain-containing protein [Polaromonas naphthalenivorans]ABM36515.1 Lytic transglycosylase, catalytic [Polaromonas naphthalenivorans CJ2]
MRLKLFSLLNLPLLAVLLTALHAPPARADIWAYIDGQGVTHFSSLQLDERYELFSRGGESFTTGKTAGNPAQGAQGVAATPPRLRAYFELSPGYKAVRHLLREASDKHGIDYELLQALIATESGFNAQAVSPKGAVGLMQLIPPTAARYGVKSDKTAQAEQKLTDPRTNIRAGSSYLSDLMKLFPGEIELAIAAYNAGEGAVQRAGNRIPNYPETKNYVKTVMQLYNQLKPASTGRSTSVSSGRVRMEMMGGASGRANMPAALAASPSLVLPEVAARLD